MAEVKFDQIRIKKLGAMPGQEGRKRYDPYAAQDLTAKKRQIKEVITAGGYRVPENLLPKEDDSAEAVENKKRKLQNIKKMLL